MYLWGRRLDMEVRTVHIPQAFGRSFDRDNSISPSLGVRSWKVGKQLSTPYQCWSEHHRKINYTNHLYQSSYVDMMVTPSTRRAFHGMYRELSFFQVVLARAGASRLSSSSCLHRGLWNLRSGDRFMQHSIIEKSCWELFIIFKALRNNNNKRWFWFISHRTLLSLILIIACSYEKRRPSLFEWNCRARF